MLFNSYVFLFLFLPLVLVGWWLVFRGDRARLVFLTLASYVFYSYFQFPLGLWLLPLLIASTSADYVAGHRIARSEAPSVRRAWLIGALSVNLGLLFVFKYLGFFGDTVNSLLEQGHAPWRVPVVHLLLPIGISFYTFNSMSYTIDIYRRNVAPARSLVHYSTFVALFPHLIAGPIIRYRDLDLQLRNLASRLEPGMFSLGAFFFVCGLAKKLLIADNLAPTVDRLYSVTDSLAAIPAWMASIGAGLQLYFDFSGYSDMAVGLALWLGFYFPQNFDSPLRSRNILEFWARWHMTLARWMRDYLFFSIGGSRGTTARTARNILITFLLVGLWHGAAWTFVAWGLWHGVWLVGGQAMQRRGLEIRQEWLARSLLYAGITLSMVLFRAPDMETALHMFQALFGANGLGLDAVSSAPNVTSVSLIFVASIVALTAFVQFVPNTWQYGLRFRSTRTSAVLLGLVFVACVLMVGKPSPFLYFQF